MANLTLSVRFDYEYGAVSTNMTLGEPYQESFKPIDHCNDTFGAYLSHNNGILRGSGKMERTLEMREHFAKDLAEHITKGLLEEMSKNDLVDGYVVR